MQDVKCRIRPLAGYVVIKYDKPDELSAGGIVVPESAQEKPEFATVVAASLCIYTPEGERPLQVVDGDKVILQQYAGSRVVLDGEEYVVVRETEILAVLH